MPNMEQVTAVYKQHIDRYMRAIDQALAHGDADKVGVLSRQVRALREFAREIGITEWSSEYDLPRGYMKT